MGYLIFKYAVTAAIIVAASELARRSDRWGALILALPLMSVATLIWLYADHQSEQKIANHAWYTFWYVLPTLPMFLLFPPLLRSYGFAVAMVSFVAGTALCFTIFALVVKRFGISLW